MSESEGYSRESTWWFFYVGGEEWAVTGYDDDWVAFKETRCNGQEDNHVVGEALLVDGLWALDKSAYPELEHYRDGKTQLARDIEAFLNQHGAPVSKCPDPECDAEVDEAEYGSYAWCDECGHVLGEGPRVVRFLIPGLARGNVRLRWERFD